MANEADEVLLGNYAASLTSYGNSEEKKKERKKKCSLRTMSREYDCLANFSTKEAFTLLLGN